MSKVLVDRELLERAMYAKDGKELIYANRALRAILDQPAEAEGVDFGFDDRSVKVSQEAYSIFLEREQHRLAALSAVTAERDQSISLTADYIAMLGEAGLQIDRLTAEVEMLRDNNRKAAISDAAMAAKEA